MLQTLQAAGLLALAFPYVSLAQENNTFPQSFVTSADGTHRLSSFDVPVAGGSAGSKLTVDDTESGRKQEILGFGAAITDATVSVFGSLSPEQKTALLADLFTTTTEDGIGFNLMRNTIAASDLSAFAYSYDASDTPDPDLEKFNLTKPGEDMLSLTAEFLKTNPAMKLLGSVWSPPGWMKLNGVQMGTTKDNNINMDHAAAYGKYFVKYIEAFAKGGVSVDAITIQNEPLNSQAGYPTMYLFADESAELINQHVGPALKNAGLKTSVWAYDHNTDVPSYPQTVLDGARDYVDAVAWHCYSPHGDWSVMSDFNARNPGVAQYMTECWTSPDNPWYNTANFLIGPLQNYASGIISWTLGTDMAFGPHLEGGCTSCRGLVQVDTSSGTYSKTIDYYIMGQFSRFVPRGAITLVTAGGSGAEIAAFLNTDGSRTVVIQNSNVNQMDVTVEFKSGDSWSGTLYAESVTTWVLPAVAA